MTTARDTGCETNFSDLDLRECTAFYTHTFQTSCRPDICPVLYLAAWCNITALTRELVGKMDKDGQGPPREVRILQNRNMFLQRRHTGNVAVTSEFMGKTFQAAQLKYQF